MPLGPDEHGIDAKRSAWEEKRARHVARLNARADALEAASGAIYQDTRTKADRIPFGQPILVGHHSEGRDRRYRDKIHKGFGKAFELQAEAEQVRHRAEAAARNTAISSDDPDAVNKLQAKVKERGDFIRLARQINDTIRAARAARKAGWEPIAVQRIVALGVSPSHAERLTRKNHIGRFGISGAELRNAAGEIARLNRRIEDLQRRAAQPVRAPERIGDAIVVEDRDTNRIQIRFEGVIPSAELRSALRGRGFVWAPSVGAWQRKLNENARWAALHILRQHYPKTVTASEAPSTPPPPTPTDAEAPAPLSGPMREPGLDDDPYVPDQTNSYGSDSPPAF
ncbi:MAG: DUF3560 domain-containing protein [Polyangiaceae bacterium]